MDSVRNWATRYLRGGKVHEIDAGDEQDEKGDGGKNINV
jgi:hypothetical protein